ncbi:hypothetical protein ACLFMI_13175 [Pseudonocardia nantongensis]|uniref:hypothetical protein n=1 Tax=Pseudonocardia nantongensis TaxID=1181885 RepID=UPI00397B53C1
MDHRRVDALIDLVLRETGLVSEGTATASAGTASGGPEPSNPDPDSTGPDSAVRTPQIRTRHGRQPPARAPPRVRLAAIGPVRATTAPPGRTGPGFWELAPAPAAHAAAHAADTAEPPF